MADIIPDNAIYDFLISKGVDVEKPKRSKDLKGRVIDGAITGINPIAGAANIGLKQLGQSSKLQEWTSWKQWALGHADWNTFWESNKDRYLRVQAEKEANELEQLIAKKNLKKPRAASYMRRWGITLVVFGSINIISLFLPPSYLTDEERENQIDAIPGSVILVMGGLWLTTKGQKNRRDLKLCSDKAMSLLEKDGVVNISKVADELNMAEDRTKLILDRAQKRNWIPFGIKLI
tara:strand:- start:149 stop:850 length:702 start_codon:yes stop_codon:yes gene_type:complete